MALMRSIDHPELLDIPLRKIFYMSAKDTPAEYTRFMNLSHTERNFDDDLRYSEFGAVPQVAEGAVPMMDIAREGGLKRYQSLEFKLGFAQSEVLREDDQHGIVGRMTVALRQSFRYLYEVQSYILLNNATSTGTRFVGFDSLALLSTAHTNLGNVSTQANKPSTDLTLSQLAVEAAVQAFYGWTGERGFPGMWTPTMAIVDKTDMYKAAKLFKNAMRFDTANHEENWVRKGPDDNGISEFVASRYFTAANQWFILAKKGDPLTGAHDLNMVVRKDPKFMTLTDPLTGNFVSWGRTRFITAYGRWQGIYGSKGF